MGRKALRLMASVPCRWASPLNEGLDITRSRRIDMFARAPFIDRLIVDV
jgi:hypothetical protein